LATIRANRALTSSTERQVVTQRWRNRVVPQSGSELGRGRLGWVAFHPPGRLRPAANEVWFFEPSFATPAGHDATVNVGSPTCSSRTRPASHRSPPWPVRHGWRGTDCYRRGVAVPVSPSGLQVERGAAGAWSQSGRRGSPPASGRWGRPRRGQTLGQTLGDPICSL